MKKQLHPGARWIFRFRGYVFGLVLAGFFSWFVFGIAAVIFKLVTDGQQVSVAWVLLVVFSYLFFVIIIGEIYAKMAYKRWFYEFTASNLKLERGIIWKRYSNVPYERVQNVDIQRGILARMFGFSTVNIQTAGFHYAGRGGVRAEGHLPAINPKESEEIRDFLMEKISKRGSGQGL